MSRTSGWAVTNALTFARLQSFSLSTKMFGSVAARAFKSSIVGVWLADAMPSAATVSFIAWFQSSTVWRAMSRSGWSSGNSGFM